MGNMNDIPIRQEVMNSPHYGQLYMSVRSKIDVFEPEFESLPLDKRFSFLYNFALSNDLLFKLRIQSTKSTAEALKFKNLGNKAFLQNKFLKALKLYTKSVAYALPNTTELAVAFANRSAALFRLTRYEACLVDVNRALKENHSELAEEWVQKLLKRKQECVAKLKENHAAKMNHLVFLSSSTIDDDTLEEWLEHRKNECEIDSNAMDVNYNDKFFLPTGNLKNPLIPNASVKFTVKYSPEKGRHMVATQDIKAGELLHIEKPYATMFKFDYSYKHCSYCFIRCEALIPCSTCSKVMYCSVGCRNDAYNRYHRIECAILPIAWELGESELAWLGLRILLIATKQGEELETILKDPAFQEPMKSTDPSVEYNFDSTFMHVYNLMFNYLRPAGKWHPGCIHAVVMLYILKHSNFFAASSSEKINHETLNAREAQVGNLLFRLIAVASNNMKIITERYEKSKLKSGDPVCIERYIAYGVYPFTSFYNHSCDENVANAFHKDTIVCHASQPIDAGQQLCIDYGMFHHETPTEERQQILQKDGNFICNCEACKNDWPTSDNFDELSQTFRPVNDVVPINQEQLFAFGRAFYEWQKTKMEKNAHSAKHLKLVCDYTSVFGKMVVKECHDYFECQRDIRLIFWMRGNYYTLDEDEVLIRLLL